MKKKKKKKKRKRKNPYQWLLDPLPPIPRGPVQFQPTLKQVCESMGITYWGPGNPSYDAMFPPEPFSAYFDREDIEEPFPARGEDMTKSVYRCNARGCDEAIPASRVSMKVCETCEKKIRESLQGHGRLRKWVDGDTCYLHVVTYAYVPSAEHVKAAADCGVPVEGPPEVSDWDFHWLSDYGVGFDEIILVYPSMAVMPFPEKCYPPMAAPHPTKKFIGIDFQPVVNWRSPQEKALSYILRCPANKAYMAIPPDGKPGEYIGWGDAIKYPRTEQFEKG